MTFGGERPFSERRVAYMPLSTRVRRLLLALPLRTEPTSCRPTVWRDPPPTPTITTGADLAQWTEADLVVRIEGFGMQALKEVRTLRALVLVREARTIQ